MKSSLKYQHTKKSIFGLVSIGVLIILGYLMAENWRLKKHLQSAESEEKVYFVAKNETLSPEIKPFNPNDYTAKDWQNLGFSEKQSAAILKYKNYLGGNFHSKEELQKCYVISEEKFNKIETSILLPKTFKKKKSDFSPTYPTFTNTKKRLKINGKINPNSFQKSDWERIGFSEKQAIAILKYKHYLGGSFHSKEELKACFVISDENFNQLKKHLLLPENTAKKELFTDEKNIQKKKIQYQKLTPIRFRKVVGEI